MKVILILYCLIIGIVAGMDTAADPNGQPLKNIVTIVAMGITIAGIFLKRKHLLLAIPIYAIFYLAFAAARTSNMAAAMGQAAGMIIPLALVYSNYRTLSQGSAARSSAEQKSV
jgi:hypothetical protein